MTAAWTTSAGATGQGSESHKITGKDVKRIVLKTKVKIGYTPYISALSPLPEVG
jgi:hypothetical protein